MGFKAAFIGINEYSSPELHNLEGARLDATALDALFRDSVSGIDARLLTDGNATRAAVDGVLAELLERATPEDTIIVAFSGHGSADQGLALSDSSLDDAASLLSMTELAARFQRTQAKNVLVLLDCCESGEGPLEALRTWGQSHEIEDAMQSSEGGARVMIAAANSLQSAWESGTMKGHGLLTASLIAVLEGAHVAVDVRELAAAAAERVRAEAARLGQDQNTVDFSFVANGFALPPLRRGSCFQAAFPDRVGAVASGSFLDLENFGIPRSVAEAWAAEYPGLNELQLAAINEKHLLHGENLLVVAPTSSGKTLLGEMAAMRAVGLGQRAVFLVPYRALASEQKQTFERRYGGENGLRVIRCTGDYGDDVSRFIRGKYDVAVLTYEMFLGIALTSPAALAHIGAIVVDEAHFIAEPERGIVLELLLTLLVAERDHGATPQIVALSAVIGDANHFDEWLRAGLLVHTKRPVPLIEGVIDRTGRYKYLDEQGRAQEMQLVQRHEVLQRRQEPSAQDLLVPLARTLIAEGRETLLIFRKTRGESSGCANYLGRELELQAATDALAALPAVASSSDSPRLRACLEHGTAFHSGDLVPEEKAVVEKAFRDAREVRLLASTTTLAAGVNTPATTVIIVDHKFPWRTPSEFTVAEYKNMAGRAGRPGFAPFGRSILYAETGIERDRLFRKYVQGTPEGVRSSFDARETDTWLLRLLRQMKTIEEERVPGLLANTFGGYSLARKDPTWAPRMQSDVATRVARMRDLGLLENHRGRLSLTRLGEACGQSSLSLDSCMHLVELLRLNPGTTARELMALVQCLDESDAYTPMQRGKTGKDRAWDRHLSSVLRPSVLRAIMRGGGDDDYQKRCKRTAVLLAWIDGRPMKDIEEQFTVNPFVAVSLGTTQSFANTTRFHLRSAADIARVLPGADALDEEEVAELIEQLERGVPAPVFELARKASGLMREELVALAAAGLATLQTIENTSEGKLLRILGTSDRIRLLEIAGVRVRAPDPVTPPA